MATMTKPGLKPGKGKSKQATPLTGPAAKAAKAGSAVKLAGPEADGPAKPLTQAGIKTMLKALGEGAYELFEEIEVLHNTEVQNRLCHWWRMGEKFLAVEDRWKEEGLTAFCTCLGIANHREVRLGMRAAKLWTEEDLIEMVTRARQKGGRVTWQHVRLLLTQTPDERDKYLALIERERISAERLNALIDSDKSPAAAARAKGGRKFNVGATFDKAYQSGLDQTTKFVRYLKAVDEKLPGVIEKTPMTACTEKTLARVRRLREQYDGILAKAKAHGDLLVEFERRIEQHLGLLAEDRELIPPAPVPAAAAGPAPAAAPPAAGPPRRPPAAARKRG